MEKELNNSEVGNKEEFGSIELENLKLELKARDEKITGLGKSLAEKEKDIKVLNKTVEDARQAIVETSLDISEAVAAYREMAGQANPGLPPGMIKGGTVKEINDSIKNAKDLVEKVRQEIGAETVRVRVPAGAPPRTMPDISVLSPREKIKLAVEGR